MEQLSLSLKNSVYYQEDDYQVSESNFAAYTYIKKWPKWSNNNKFERFLYLYGNPGCGKTHLSYIWQSISNAKFIDKNNINNFQYLIKEYDNFIIEDIEELVDFQKDLLHFINLSLEQRKYFLITSNINSNKLNFDLADLKSRINALFSIKINDPDEELIKSLLLKQFCNKNIRINLTIINYITSRVERSFVSVKKLIDEIDQKSLAQKRKITISFIKEILE